MNNSETSGTELQKSINQKTNTRKSASVRKERYVYYAGDKPCYEWRYEKPESASAAVAFLLGLAGTVISIGLIKDIFLQINGLEMKNYDLTLPDWFLILASFFLIVAGIAVLAKSVVLLEHGKRMKKMSEIIDDTDEAICPECKGIYLRNFHRTCPYCGAKIMN